jgi:NAD(P)-dependent dehydrogenase (short-subunit alcohol dehydrogenase family)
MLDENLESAHRALVALVPRLVARRGGSVVVIGSRNVERPWAGAGAAAYTVAKSAVVALARTVAAEVLDAGVRVNAVLPSTIDTPANRAAMPKADPSRWVAPASIAEVIAFLLSEAARDVSGAVIPVYGRA